MNKRPLEIIAALTGAVHVITGIVQMMGIHDPLYANLYLPEDAKLDSNMRFWAGVSLGLGLGLGLIGWWLVAGGWWLVQHLAQETVLFRFLW